MHFGFTFCFCLSVRTHFIKEETYAVAEEGYASLETVFNKMCDCDREFMIIVRRRNTTSLVVHENSINRVECN